MGPPDGPKFARLDGPDGSVYSVTKTKLVIGRDSTHSATDLVVQENNYVSRGHLVLQRGQDATWTLMCNGKNGVFVDSQLIKKGARPTPIPKM